MSKDTLLRKLLLHPEARHLDLDSPQATEVHARLIREKKFLNQLYRRYYSDFETAYRLSPPGRPLEIGAGGGFLEAFIPDILKIDVRPGADVDFVASALDLPFADSSVSAIFMLNVLHHLKEPSHFFEEASRVLSPNGRVLMIEPYVSWLSRQIYGKLHHEPFDPNTKEWRLPEGGPLSSANDALPWVIFVRDRARFETLFPKMQILRIQPHTALLYLLSGGLSMRSFVPGIAFNPLFTVEKSIGSLMRYLGSMMTIELTRVPS